PREPARRDKLARLRRRGRRELLHPCQGHGQCAQASSKCLPASVRQRSARASCYGVRLAARTRDRFTTLSTAAFSTPCRRSSLADIVPSHISGPTTNTWL